MCVYVTPTMYLTPQTHTRTHTHTHTHTHLRIIDDKAGGEFAHNSAGLVTKDRAIVEISAHVRQFDAVAALVQERHAADA